MNHTVAYAGGVYLLVCCLLGGLMARRKGDYFSRGFCISLMAGIFAPIFFAFSPTSHARQGDEKDQHLWHVWGVFPTITHVLVVMIVWLLVARA
ncbi:MAG: hypothetical protein KJ720_01625 [Proteobacteria bacterium]|nr:hypothetical protein [Pseudomonadota bacterium]MBU1449449.1 hypothetical protein [Pseudomonadota bacterium]MBU2469558.1 hypothetical protein [Pseudomonadota bacterium]MBU2517063.1 hypothetical protein [Pseudomonadota bacterium]